MTVTEPMQPPDAPPPSRRPLKTRGRAWARALAAMLSRRGVAPNAISAFSLVPAIGAGAGFLLVPHAGRAGQVLLLLLAAGFIQLRLLANMLDGLVAVEGGRKTATGDLFNEVPDRVADVLILVPAGYAVVWLPTLGPTLGWLTALLAVLTAYVRVFGGSLGLPQSFIGPMAKQHRMGILTLSCLGSAVEAAVAGFEGRVLLAGMAVIGVGSVITAGRRLARIAAQLRERSGP